MPALSVVVPAFNEEDRLGPTLDRISAYCAAAHPSFEVIVADDGSRDGTVARAEARGVRVISLGRNRGKGAAVRAGMLAARGDHVLFSDADLATPIEELGKPAPAVRTLGGTGGGIGSGGYGHHRYSGAG